LPNMLYGRVLRCPYAHAKVTKFDSSAASKRPGGKAVIRAPITQVRFAGAPVAAVAATTPELAQDAARAIVVEYEKLPHVVTAELAMKPDSPQVLPGEGVGSEPNLAQKGKDGDPQKVEAAFAGAEAVIEAEYRTPRLHHSCLET